MALVRILLSKCRYLTVPEIIHSTAYAKVKITCFGKCTQQPEKLHFGRDDALETIQAWLTAGWNIVKISTSNHEQTETFNIHISMTKYPTPPRLMEKDSKIATKTVCYFHHYDSKLSAQDLKQLSLESRAVLLPIIRKKTTCKDI